MGVGMIAKSPGDGREEVLVGQVSKSFRCCCLIDVLVLVVLGKSEAQGKPGVGRKALAPSSEATASASVPSHPRPPWL